MSAAGDEVLMLTLEVAVPLWIPRVTPGDTTRGHQLADLVGSKGDAIMFRSKPGATAEAFNGLAEGLALLAHQPGGVLFGGRHWCATEHRMGVACQAITELTCGTP